MKEQAPSNAGLGDYARKLKGAGLTGLAHSVQKRIGGTYQERQEAIKALGLPTEPNVMATMKEFDNNPGKFFDELTRKLDGYCPRTYYAVLATGKVRVSDVSREELIDFIRANRQKFPDDYSFPITSCDYAFSGSLDVDKDGRLSGVFALAPYSSIAHNERPADFEITEDKFGSGIPKLTFVGAMGGGNSGDYRDDPTEYKTYTGSTITKTQMAKEVLAARDLLKQAIGLERGYYVPNGHYRVVFTNTEYGYKPYFIKAVQSDI